MKFRSYERTPDRGEVDVDDILGKSRLRKEAVNMSEVEGSAWKEKMDEFFVPSFSEEGDLVFDVYEGDVNFPVAEIMAQNPEFLKNVVGFMFSKSYRVLVVSRLKSVELDGREELKVVFSIYGQRPGTIKEHDEFAEKIRSIKEIAEQTVLDALEFDPPIEEIDNIDKK